MEKRNLFSMFFGTKKQTQEISKTQLQLLNNYNAQFTTLSNNSYDSKVARQCIDRIATHCAKLIPKHIQDNISNNIKGDINFLLSNQPNPIMTKFDFIYKTISMLYTDSNAFIYIARDKQGFITGFYPVLAQSYNLLQDKSGNIYLQFTFVNGQLYTIPYLDLIHLRLFYNKHDIFGSSNSVLKTDLDTAHTASEGIKNAIKTSNNLRGILKFTNSMLKEKDIKASRDEFVKDFVDLQNESGIAAVDGKAEFQEINMKPITLDREQLEQVNYNIFDYYGISEKIVKNNFNSVEWNAFFEGVIEPRAIQLSDAFTNKIFTYKARKDGHRIIFTANRLQYASLDSKINLIKVAGSYGLLTKDDGREILDMAPLGGEEGKKILQSLNNIDSSIANNYQGGKEDGESAFKECRNIRLENCHLNLRYPFWHDIGLEISNCNMEVPTRASIWYASNIKVNDTKIMSVKCFRECTNLELKNVEMASDEGFWYCNNVKAENLKQAGPYSFFNCKNVDLDKFELNGKYSFQYCENIKITNSNLKTKDALWNSKNMYVKDTILTGEYLAWYSENLTLENCHISGTQPLCYCKNLKLINCTMDKCDFSFEYSDVEADVKSHVLSIKNVLKGKVVVDSVGEIINSEQVYECHGEVEVRKK